MHIVCIRSLFSGRPIARFMLRLPVSRGACTEAGHAAAAAAVPPRWLQASRLHAHAAAAHMHRGRMLSSFTAAAAYQDSNALLQGASHPASSNGTAAPGSNGSVKRPSRPTRRSTSSSTAQQDAAAAAAAGQPGNHSSPSGLLGGDLLRQAQQEQAQPQRAVPTQQQQQLQPQGQQQQQQQTSNASRRPRRRTTSLGDVPASSSPAQPAMPVVSHMGSSVGQTPPAVATAAGNTSCAPTSQPPAPAQQQRAAPPAAATPAPPPPAAASSRSQPHQQQQQQQQTPVAAAAASSTEFDIAVRNKFSSRPQAALQPPSAPPSAAAAAWCGGLGIGPAVLQQWGAGMALVPHPETKQLVEVLALPYYRRGVLVDMRCLLLQQGRLLGSWLAVGARELYMQRELQDASSVVFVSCELDALLLSAAGYPAIALTQQTPIWLDASSSQQQVPWLPPLQQVLQLRQRQQMAHLQQQQQWQQQQHRHVPEDPRLRLSGLAAESDKLKRQYESGAARTQISSSSSSSSSNRSGFELEGLLVSDVSQAAPSGLSLLLPSASIAVIAMPQGAEKSCSNLVSSHLAGLLGEVHCRQMQWPEAYPADVAAAAAAAAANGDGSLSQPQPDPQQQQLVHQQQQQQLIALQDDLLADPTAPQGQGTGWDVVLLNALHGPQGVAAAVGGAYVWPIMGLERFSDYTFDLLTYYQTPNMDQIALSTGWPSLDEYYRVAPGEVTLVTGVPNSGKSEWLDALAVNLALQHGWRFAVCSMEKRPRDHARQLLEKIARRPLLSAGYAGEVPRMTAGELDVAYSELCDHFFVIASGEDIMPSMAWVLEKAKAAKIQFGISGLIIDPYNELDPTRGLNMKEHEHVNEIMGLLRRFARENNVHCWLVAHPRQMGNMWKGERPGLQDVSGGANFMNKTDNGIIVHRNWSKLKELQDRAAGDKAGGGGSKKRPAPQQSSSGNGAEAAGSAEGGQGGDEQQQQLALQNAEFEVQVIVEKVRNKTTGSRGQCVLMYDRVTGRYHELGEDPDRRGLLEDVYVQTGSPGSLEVIDMAADADWQPAQDAASPYGAEMHHGYVQQQGVDEDVALQHAAEDREFYS